MNWLLHRDKLTVSCSLAFSDAEGVNNNNNTCLALMVTQMTLK